ncbi:MAG TPA: hypothetical protein VHM25_28285 [Polyangiaceae bacterium]|jgi:hypothetical protein|nr:hypothetical protein [Polyangiaceae bacterium]
MVVRSVPRFIILAALASATTMSCAQSPITPLRVSAHAPGPWPPIREGQPLIIDFKAGDRIPVSIQADGEVVETTPSPSTIWLTAKRDFSVRIRGAEIKTSLDGVHFDEKPAVPGHFQLGLEATRETGAKVVVRITTPVHAKP